MEKYKISLDCAKAQMKIVGLKRWVNHLFNLELSTTEHSKMLNSWFDYHHPDASDRASQVAIALSN